MPVADQRLPYLSGIIADGGASAVQPPAVELPAVSIRSDRFHDLPYARTAVECVISGEERYKAVILQDNGAELPEYFPHCVMELHILIPVISWLMAL